MRSDEMLIIQALAGLQERLTRQDSDHLMECLFTVRSAGALSGQARAKLHSIADDVLGGRRAG